MTNRNLKSAIFALYNRDKTIARNQQRDTKRYDRAMGIVTSGAYAEPDYYQRYLTTLHYCNCRDFEWRSKRLANSSGITYSEAIARLAEKEPCKHIVVEQWLRELDAMSTSETERPPAHPGKMTKSERLAVIFRDSYYRYNRMWRSTERNNDRLREAVDVAIPMVVRSAARIPDCLPISLQQGERMLHRATLDYLHAVRHDDPDVIMYRDARRIVDNLVRRRNDIHINKIVSGCSCSTIVSGFGDNERCMLHTQPNDG